MIEIKGLADTEIVSDRTTLQFEKLFNVTILINARFHLIDQFDINFKNVPLVEHLRQAIKFAVDHAKTHDEFIYNILKQAEEVIYKEYNDWKYESGAGDFITVTVDGRDYDIQITQFTTFLIVNNSSLDNNQY